ncbi:hypothetical protein MalM25_24150 [Planctomycetes bacterium MalM25]|nr:hypothetical protein MalM25_24150 [Planctomycetes bacterium MalM25]
MRMVRSEWTPAGTLLVFAVVAVGCSSSIDRPAFNPEKTSAMALEQCDANGDGSIDKSEAAAAPGLRRAFVVWDLNADGQLSGDELAGQISKYRNSSASIVSAGYTVTYNKKPLEDATVTLEPEPFMGSGFESVSGVTDATGFVSLNRPNVGEGDYPGIYLGVYRVRISKEVNGQEMLPAKYNTESELGANPGAGSRAMPVSTRYDLE